MAPLPAAPIAMHHRPDVDPEQRERSSARRCRRAGRPSAPIARLVELREDLAEAEAWNDPERAARAQAEIDALAHELSAAVGLGGRDRATGSPAERARVSVTRAIRAAMVRIDEADPALGAHLDATIRTGTFCSYSPDPRAPIRWDLGSG